MAGVTFLTLVVILILIPAIIGSYLVAQRRSHALEHVWFTGLTVLLAIGVAVTFVLMPRV